MTGSVLFHVQYLLGIGHLQRSLHIAEALARQGVAVTFVSGGIPVSALRGSRADVQVVQLPPIAALDARFELVDATTSRPVDDLLREARRSALLDAFAAAQPQVVVIEGYPFARGAFRFELDPLIAAARARGAAVICSVRDIIHQRDDPARHARTAARVRSDFDTVLVHGDPSLIPFDISFPLASEIADQLVYTGYVAEAARPTPPAEPDDGIGEVLVSGGGGPAGYTLMQTAIEACRGGFLAGARWRLLAGANLPAERFDALAGSAPRRVIVDRFRSDFSELLKRCRVSVSQAGYNTALDILTAKAPAVLVPFAAERETEQLLRAERLAALGVAELVRESELTAEILGKAIERAAAKPPAEIAVDMKGAERSARLIVDIIRTGRFPSGGFVGPVNEGMLPL